VSDMSIYDEYRIVINAAQRRLIVSGSHPPPCNARFEPQDANRLGQIGSHIWSTI
jgi:hypothetical protein